MALYPAHRVVRGPTIALRPDGTYTMASAPAPATPTPHAPDPSHLAVAMAALRELAERRRRDTVARRLLSEAGVVDT